MFCETCSLNKTKLFKDFAGSVQKEANHFTFYAYGLRQRSH